MIHSRPLEAEHLMLLDVQPWQRMPEFEITHEYSQFLVDNSYSSFSIWNDDKILAAGGAVMLWEGRAEIWLLVDKMAGKSMFGLHKVARRFLDAMPFRRLETGCEIEWSEAHRWLKMLGFEYEHRARKYTPTGRDLDIYVRIK